MLYWGCLYTILIIIFWRFPNIEMSNTPVTSGVSKVWQAWHVSWAPLWRRAQNCLAKIKIFMHSFVNIYFAPHARDGTRLDCARDTKQVWSLVPPCANLRSFGSKCTKKMLVTLLVFFGAPRSDFAPPWWFSNRGIFPLSPRHYAPAHAFINCKAASTPRPYLKH